MLLNVLCGYDIALMLVKNTLETTDVLCTTYLGKVRRRKRFDGWPVLCPKVIAVLVVVVVWVVVVLLGGLGGGARSGH